ncbi:MAG TPA: glutathione S-transferase N-terminal domain-containing protein, partial [Verrucomicrobiae bacterium]|nr:glutathione S-transferase N-terminal domain-containing protein [Verrucomicrobiae bacterium]
MSASSDLAEAWRTTRSASRIHVSRFTDPAFPLVSPKMPTYIATVAIARDTFDMIELVQFPWSPFCIVQRRILEFAGVRFKTTNIPNGDRSLVWKLTKERYYGVPIIKDGKSVVFEVSEDS